MIADIVGCKCWCILWVCEGFEAKNTRAQRTWGHILHWYLRPVPLDDGWLWWLGLLPLLAGPLDNGWGTTSPAELGGDDEMEDPELFDRGAPYKFGSVGDAPSANRLQCLYESIEWTCNDWPSNFYQLNFFLML